MYELQVKAKSSFTRKEVDEALKELMREARIRQFVYPREHVRFDITRSKEGLSREEGRRRWNALLTAISVLKSLLDNGFVKTGDNGGDRS